MRIIEPSYEIVYPTDDLWGAVLERIEEYGRICYKSEGRATPGSAPAFVKMLIERGHESVIEHGSMVVKFICDRGVTHELVRHRLASYSQESTRFCNYSKDKFDSQITVIKPVFWNEDSLEYLKWLEAMRAAEDFYMTLLANGAKPEQARSVLPNSLKTEIIMTANLREWRHVFKLRAGPKAHPQMRQLMIPLLYEVRPKLPIIFDDIYDFIREVQE